MSLKPKEIQELIEFIDNTGLAEVDIETEKFKLRVKRNSEVTTVAIPQQSVQMAATPAPQVAAPASTPTTPTVATTDAAPKQEDTSNYITVKSPMIGTFYRSPNPESAPFVSVGDTIQKGDTIGIIEAMKLFNEIESDVAGKIVKVLVENATPVEYDQPLFLIEPN